MADRGVLFNASEQRWRSAAGRANVSPEEFVAILNRGERMCTSCRKIFPRTSEHFRSSTSKDIDSLRAQCRGCQSTYDAAKYRRNHEAIAAKRKQYQMANRDRLYAYNRAWGSNRHRALKTEAILALGGCCACCGEAEPLFLDLDHIHNDGAEHRKVVKNTTQLILLLKNTGWPRDRVQLLCSNCNQGKARNGGTCPHQEKRNGG